MALHFPDNRSTDYINISLIIPLCRRLISELVESEKQYVNDLRTVVEVSPVFLVNAVRLEWK